MQGRKTVGPRDKQDLIDQLRDAHRKSRELARQTMDLTANVARLRKEWERRPPKSQGLF